MPSFPMGNPQLEGNGHDAAEDALSKRRLKWTEELKNSVQNAVDQLGGLSKATPSKILSALKNPNITLLQVKSFLQKQRLAEEREKSVQDALSKGQLEAVGRSGAGGAEGTELTPGEARKLGAAGSQPLDLAPVSSPLGMSPQGPGLVHGQPGHVGLGQPATDFSTDSFAFNEGQHGKKRARGEGLEEWPRKESGRTVGHAGGVLLPTVAWGGASQQDIVLVQEQRGLESSLDLMNEHQEQEQMNHHHGLTCPQVQCQPQEQQQQQHQQLEDVRQQTALQQQLQQQQQEQLQQQQQQLLLLHLLLEEHDQQNNQHPGQQEQQLMPHTPLLPPPSAQSGRQGSQAAMQQPGTCALPASEAGNTSQNPETDPQQQQSHRAQPYRPSQQEPSQQEGGPSLPGQDRVPPSPASQQWRSDNGPPAQHCHSHPHSASQGLPRAPSPALAVPLPVPAEQHPEADSGGKGEGAAGGKGESAGEDSSLQQILVDKVAEQMEFVGKMQTLLEEQCLMQARIEAQHKNLVKMLSRHTGLSIPEEVPHLALPGLIQVAVGSVSSEEFREALHRVTSLKKESGDEGIKYMQGQVGSQLHWQQQRQQQPVVQVIPAEAVAGTASPGGNYFAGGFMLPQHCQQQLEAGAGQAPSTGHGQMGSIAAGSMGTVAPAQGRVRPPSPPSPLGLSSSHRQHTHQQQQQQPAHAFKPPCSPSTTPCSQSLHPGGQPHASSWSAAPGLTKCLSTGSTSLLHQGGSRQGGGMEQPQQRHQELTHSRSFPAGPGYAGSAGTGPTPSAPSTPQRYIKDPAPLARGSPSLGAPKFDVLAPPQGRAGTRGEDTSFSTGGLTHVSFHHQQHQHQHQQHVPPPAAAPESDSAPGQAPQGGADEGAKGVPQVNQLLLLQQLQVQVAEQRTLAMSIAERAAASGPPFLPQSLPTTAPLGGSALGSSPRNDAQAPAGLGVATSAQDQLAPPESVTAAICPPAQSSNATKNQTLADQFPGLAAGWMSQLLGGADGPKANQGNNGPVGALSQEMNPLFHPSAGAPMRAPSPLLVHPPSSRGCDPRSSTSVIPPFACPASMFDSAETDPWAGGGPGVLPLPPSQAEPSTFSEAAEAMKGLWPGTEDAPLGDLGQGEGLPALPGSGEEGGFQGSGHPLGMGDGGAKLAVQEGHPGPWTHGGSAAPQVGTAPAGNPLVLPAGLPFPGEMSGALEGGRGRASLTQRSSGSRCSSTTSGVGASKAAGAKRIAHAIQSAVHQLQGLASIGEPGADVARGTAHLEPGVLVEALGGQNASDLPSAEAPQEPASIRDIENIVNTLELLTSQCQRLKGALAPRNGAADGAVSSHHSPLPHG